MKNIKSIQLNSGNIIDIRKKLDKEITQGYHTIRTYNVMSKAAIKAGLDTNADLKALYNHITQLQNKRIMIKGILCSLNNGITTFDYEAFKKTNNYDIFAACEAKEAIAQLKMVPTLSPTEKAKKGLKTLAKREIFTSAKIASLIKGLQLVANKHDANLAAFNEKTSIDITNSSGEFEEYLNA